MAGDDLQWFLSTLAQCLAAIMGVGGMLVVFKLQRIHDTIETLLDRIRETMAIVLESETEPYLISPGGWVKKWEREGQSLAEPPGFEEGPGKMLGDSPLMRDFLTPLSEAKFNSTNGITMQIKRALADRHALRRSFLEFAGTQLVFIMFSLIFLLYGTAIMNLKPDIPFIEDYSNVIAYGFLLMVGLSVISTAAYLRDLLDLRPKKLSDYFKKFKTHPNSNVF